MARSDSLPQINLGVQGGTQGVHTHLPMYCTIHANIQLYGTQSNSIPLHRVNEGRAREKTIEQLNSKLTEDAIAFKTTTDIYHIYNAVPEPTYNKCETKTVDSAKLVDNLGLDTLKVAADTWNEFKQSFSQSFDDKSLTNADEEQVMQKMCKQINKIPIIH
ncbi:hypothetical protein TNCV_4256101 [Trichonephila clavipes]|nr:hypothetical protein TNCV_4256101 [Trichonephila clavipes]